MSIGKRITIIILLVYSNSSVALTKEQLSRLIGIGEESQRERTRWHHNGDLENILPVVTPTKNLELIKPSKQPDLQINKYSISDDKELVDKDSGNDSPNENVRSDVSNKGEIVKTSTETLGEQYYYPLNQNSDDVKSESTNLWTTAIQNYGVRPGTWVRASITNSFTNADPGEVIITLKSPLVGQFRTLPANTELFGTKQYNVANGRMDIEINRAILPNLQEMPLNALVHDTNKVVGLAVQMLKKGGVKVSINRGLLAAGHSVIGNLAEDTPGGSAIKATTGDLLDTTADRLESTTQDLVLVSKQDILLRIMNKF